MIWNMYLYVVSDNETNRPSKKPKLTDDIFGNMLLLVYELVRPMVLAIVIGREAKS